MFIHAGPYKGATIKFAIYVTSTYPLCGKPTIKIISPTTILHPQINKMDRKLNLQSWDPEKDNLLSIVNTLRNLLETFESPPEDDPKINLIVRTSRDQVFENPPEPDVFSPCMAWTPELLAFKHEILARHG